VRVLPVDLKVEADKLGRPAVQLGRRLHGHGGSRSGGGHRGEDESVSVPSAGTFAASKVAAGRSPPENTKMPGVPGMLLQVVPERDAYAAHLYDDSDKDDGRPGRGGSSAGDGGGGGDVQGSIDRNTVKRVSTLIVERETAALRAKQRAEEARQRVELADKFKPKLDAKKPMMVHDPFTEFLYTTY